MKKLRPLSFILTLVFCLTLLLSTAFAATEEELTQQKDEAAQKKAAAEYQVDMTQTTIQGIQAEITKSNTAIATLNQQISDLQATIDGLDAQQTQAESELATAEAKRDEQQKDLEERLRVMYMYGNEGYAEVLFSSTDFGDFIAKADMIASIAQADNESAAALQKIEDEIAEKKATIESKKAETEAAKEEQNQVLANQNTIKAQQNELLAKNEATMTAYKAEVAKQDAEMKEAEDGLAKIAAEKAAALEKQRQEEAAKQAAEEEARRQQEAAANASSSDSSSDSAGDSSSSDSGSSDSSASSGVTSSSGYIWPTPSSYTITDYFGYRSADATNGVGSTNHMGLDIGAGYGEPILAVASGTVTLSEYYGGYGNCVMIAHDDGYTSLYGHQSALAVSEGQYVNQGDVIGYVGSTGNSTGAHLHISIIDGSGEYLDPLNFLPY